MRDELRNPPVGRLIEAHLQTPVVWRLTRAVLTQLGLSWPAPACTSLRFKPMSSRGDAVLI